MQSILHIINSLTKTLQALLPLKPEDKARLDKKIRLEFNYNSNHIEGNTLTYGETELLLIFDKTTGNHNLREYEEMKAHDVVFELIKEWAADKEHPLSETTIKNLHEKLLVRPFWKEAITPDGQPTRRLIKIGDYKEHPNSVPLQNGEIFHYASVQETPVLMYKLIEWYRKEEEKGELHPVFLAGLLHYEFVRIHPFDDGNGRLSRLLMNYVLLRHDFPPLIIKTSDKKAYLFSLNRADAGDQNAFLEYIAKQAIWSLELMIKAAKGENLDESNDWQKKLHLLKNKTGLPEKITIKRSKEAYDFALENILLPFLNSWERKLQIIEPLFNSRRCRILINDKGTGIGDHSLIDAIHKCFDLTGILSQNIQNGEIREIKIVVSFSDLLSENLKAGFNGGEAIINFEENAVSISTVTNQRITKLYSQALSEAEAEVLTDSINNWFMNHLEEFITKNTEKKA